MSPQFISIPRLRGNYTSPQPRDVEEVKDADRDTLLSFRLAAANPTLQMSRWPGESPGALEGGGRRQPCDFARPSRRRCWTYGCGTTVENFAQKDLGVTPQVCQEVFHRHLEQFRHLSKPLREANALSEHDQGIGLLGPVGHRRISSFHRAPEVAAPCLPG